MRAIPLRPLEHPGVTHAIVRALQSMDYDVSNITGFLKQAQNVDFGLSAEHEFAAIAAWLGRCRLIHQIGQERFTSPGFQHDMKIPDLLAVIEHHDQQRRVLIEVKTTKGSTHPNQTSLRARPRYLDALRRYADTLGLPVLIAWHPRNFPFWMLFDPEGVPYDHERQCFSISEVMKNDLMSSLLGDFSVTPLPDAGMSIRLEFVGPKQPAPGGYSAQALLKDMYWHDSQGHRLSDAPEGVLVAMLVTCEERTTEDATGLTKSFVSTGESTRAHLVLKALAGYALADDQRVHWRAVVHDLDRFLARDELLEDLQGYFGSCIRYILHLVPHVWPQFVPEEWKHL